MFVKKLALAVVAMFIFRQVCADTSERRFDSSGDPSTCICGINAELLDKLESLIQLGIIGQQVSTCNLQGREPILLGTSSSSSSTSTSSSKLETPAPGSSSASETAVEPQSVSQNQLAQEETKRDEEPVKNDVVPGEAAPASSSFQLPPTLTSSVPSSLSLPSSLGSGGQSQTFNGGFSFGSPTFQLPSFNYQTNHSFGVTSQVQHELGEQASSAELIAKLTEKLQQQMQAHVSGANINAQAPSTSSATTTTTFTISHDNKSPVGSTSFTFGLPSKEDAPSLAQLNESSVVDIQEMSNALQSTVPNVVSNIFTNLEQNLNPLNMSASFQSSKADETQQLVSIDGSISQVPSGLAIDEISQQGERLLMTWLEHQIKTLHLTASMANYIRKSSLTMFRRIVKQYIERAKQLGGSIEDNVRRANQLALSNTQGLIAYLLKNYINYAGGFMQIIGEQVSRVGKQIDSTGDSIAHISLNPFDIISNVIDSLPNPSSYSNYFRMLGRHLISDIRFDKQMQQQQQQQTQDGQQQVDQSAQQQQQRPQSVIGSLSKTLSSWLG